ncbi:MAG: primosomal protein N' [Microbacteriaceae bacterium]
MNIARVLIESPIPRLDRLFDYAIPERLEGTVVTGGRVRVPLGRGSRLVDGYVIERGTEAQQGVVLAEIDSVLGAIPVVTPALWSLVRAVSSRNGGSASDVLRIAIPKRAVRAEKGVEIAPRAVVTPRTGSKSVIALDAGVVGTDAGPTLRAFEQIADVVRTATGGVVVVVPDWRDLELLARALNGVDHTVWDSTGTPSERYIRYLRVLSGESRIVIGTRSAVYAPVIDLSTLIVVNESDPLLDEPLSPFVHARDAAIVRHGIEGGDLIFASLTPSVDVARFRDLGFVEATTATPQRPTVILANDPTDDSFAGKARIPASAWRAVREALERGPVLIQVARPGFTPAVVCKACRTPHRCARCRSPLGGARDGSTLCRVCGNQPLGISCSHCGGRELAFSGIGSVRTADELGRAFPNTKVVLSDAEHRHLEIPRTKALVVATRGAEPIVEGGFEAVLIVDGDRELQRPGLRTTENCLRWWGSAAAFTSSTGVVVLANVDGAFGAQFSSGQWESVVDTELVDRRALSFPPATRAISVIGSVADLGVVRALPEVSGHRVMGPVPVAKGHRIVILADYASSPTVIDAIRAHIVGSKASTLRLHCDDLDVFDEFDED